MTARKRVGTSLWAQLSYLYSKLEGNYSGAVSTSFWQTNPGLNMDFDYYRMSEGAYGRLELDRPHQVRLDEAYTFPFGLTFALGAYVRSGVPITLTNALNSYYPYHLFPEGRGTYGRTPTDWEADVALSWPIQVGPVTVTPQVFVFRVFNRQTPTYVGADFNPYASFVDDPSSPYYGQAGITPGAPGCEGSTVPCTDNPDFGKSYFRTQPRQLRVALRVSF